jgi:8-oxo-dGTP diphosphatase
MGTSIGCGVIIHDQLNRVLIAQRSADKELFPLFWETIGGGLEGGESPEECIRREAMEEIGCQLNDLKLFDVMITNYQGTRYISIIFTATIHEPISINNELIQTKWIFRDDMNDYCFMGTCKERLDKYFIKEF